MRRVICFWEYIYTYNPTGNPRWWEIPCQPIVWKRLSSFLSRIRYPLLISFRLSSLQIGESNVYTLGDIGAHRIVCTKLPTVGHTREALTAAGNTTTRLLGTFQKVDYVFLVGVGGGVPHYTDYKKHVRLGDVVVSYPTRINNKFVYMYCESAKMSDDGSYQFETKEYCPTNLGLQDIAANIKKQVCKGKIMLKEWQYFCLLYIRKRSVWFLLCFYWCDSDKDALM